MAAKKRQPAGASRRKAPSLAGGKNPIEADSDTHARAVARHTSAEDKVAHILDLMTRFRYRRGSTAKRLAREWGVSVGHVHDLACDARKKVREHVGDVDTIASEVIPGLMVAFRKAVESTNPKMNANVAGIAAQLLDLTGLKAAKKFEHAGAEGGPIQVQTGVLVLPEEEAT